MGFLIAAIAVLILFSLTTTLVVLLIRKRRLQREESKARGSPASTFHSSSSPVLSHGAILKPTQWSYDAVRQPRSNFQVLMYGDGSRFGTESVPSLHHQHDPMAFATQGRPQARRPLMALHSIPNIHAPPSHAPSSHYAAQPVYEEIRLQPLPDSSAVVRGSSLDQLLGEERRRKPPPSVRPPPPPVMVEMVDQGAGSPMASTSSASCSCSHTSNSLDQEMEGIRVTPSPRHHHHHGSLEGSGSGSGGSPKDFSDGIRAESGYGTQRRSNHRRAQISTAGGPPHSMTYV
jgi:hypothetical protein